MDHHKTALLAGPDFYYYLDTIERELERRGYVVTSLPYPELGSRSYYALKGVGSIVDQFAPANVSIDKYEYFRRKIEDFNESLTNHLDEGSFDVFLSIKGDIIFPSTVEHANGQNCTTVLWCYDSARRFDNVLEGAKYYDRAFFYEKTDLEVVSSQNSSFLPMAYDSNIYYPLEMERDIDIVFVGRMYEQRKEILSEIIDAFPERTIHIWSKEWNWYNPLLLYEYKFKRRALSRRMANRDIPPSESNIEYNRAKICLNIHSSQQVHSLNPRTFEILGAGGFQVVDHKEMVDDRFSTRDELVTYSSIDELVDIVGYYLDNEEERERIAKNGYEKVKDSDDFSSRVEHIINNI